MTRSTCQRLLVLGLAVLALSGCGTGSARQRVDVPVAPAVRDEIAVAHEVGRLLSPDTRESGAAEARLIALTDDGRDALLAYAETIPNERDPRWLHVLDEHHALPELPTGQQIDFLLWKARRGGRVAEMRVQSGLLDLALREPDALIQRVERGGPGTDLVAMALALADDRRAIPALVALYQNPADDTDRRAASEALARLAGEERRPRVRGSDREIHGDAQRISRWYRHHLEIAAEIAAEEEDDG